MCKCVFCLPFHTLQAVPTNSDGSCITVQSIPNRDPKNQGTYKPLLLSAITPLLQNVISEEIMDVNALFEMLLLHCNSP